MDSLRFDRPVQITRHAKERMTERGISEDLLLDLIETGMARYKDKTRLWLFKGYSERGDNLICAAVVLEDCVIVKTVMHHFQIEGSP
ncbi:MAG: DUF4258 domain-containing protein [Methylococcales bacterium]